MKKVLSAALAVACLGIAAPARADVPTGAGSPVIQSATPQRNVLPRTGWQVTSASGGVNGTSSVLDGTDRTAWTASGNQTGDLHIRIDLGKVQTFDTIVLDGVPGSDNYLRSYNAYISNDANSWGSWVAGSSGLNSSRSEISLGTRTARYVTLQSGSDKVAAPWSVAELSLATTIPSANGFAIKRAINININEANTNGGQYRGLPLPEADIQRVKTSGLDTVRVMTDGSYFMGTDGALLNVDRLDAAIDNVTSVGLNAVVDIHATSKEFNARILCGDRLPQFERFLQELASHLASKYPLSDVALELLNEPFDTGCGLDQSYAGKLQAMYAAARRGSSAITIVLSPLESSSMFRLDDLNKFIADNRADVNTIFTVHYYGPLEFSHQGAFYIENQEYLNYFGKIPYPSTRITTDQRGALWRKIEQTAASKGRTAWMAAAKVVFDAYFAWNNGNGYGRGDIEFIVNSKVLGWARTQGIEPSRIWLGEFGVQGSQTDTRDVPEPWRVNPIEGADATDRAEWTRDVRQLFESNGMAWGYFQFGNGAYSVLEDRNFPTSNFSAWDRTLTDALGLVKP
jgi:endoglucanase